MNSIIKKVKQKKGFTLVEVIVVLVILAILAAILIPAYIHYIEKAHEKTCKVERSQIERYYDLYLTADNKRDAPFDEAAFEKYVSENYGDMNSMCPSGGTYTVTESTKVGDTKRIVKVTCSVHDEDSTENSLKSLEAVLNQMIKNNFKSLQSKEKGFTIDSEANGDPNDFPFKPEVERLLNSAGIDTSKSSWRIYKNANGDYNLFWCNTKITNMDPGQKVDVVRYNTVTKDYYIGTATIELKKEKDGNVEYNILRPNTDFKKK